MRGLRMDLVATGFDFPVVGLTVPGSDRVWIAERGGAIWELDGDTRGPDPLLDLSAMVQSFAWEQGLVGMALHPDYPRDPRLFLSYTDIEDSSQVIVSYRVDAQSGVDTATRAELLRVEQLSEVHQGGTIRFGPDGMLWIGLGDGGHDGTVEGPPSQDPAGHGQNPFTLPGSLLRIDVDGAPPYSIPPDNPFFDGGSGAPEVWAYGLRNPWSFWFDRERVFIGDVGFQSWEEIDVLDRISQAGSNLGWSVMEGPACLRMSGCDRSGTTLPALALLRTPGTCAVVVGPPYAGVAMPELAGHLAYGDLCGSWVRTVPIGPLLAGDPGTSWLEDLDLRITAFFEGPDREWYLLTIGGGVYRLEPDR